jgi:GT2 family glycosyltransferase
MIFQPIEEELTLLAIKQLGKILSEDTKLFLHCNSCTHGIPKKIFDIGRIHNVSISQSIKNLGVAGARNILISRILKDYDPNIYLSLDNDLIIPSNYIEDIKNIYKKNGYGIGIISPVLVQAPLLNFPSLRQYRYPDYTKLKRQLYEIYFNEGNTDVFYHAGILNWKKHYIQNPAIRYLLYFVLNTVTLNIFRDRFKKKNLTGNTFLAKNDEFIRSILTSRENLISVDSLPGGVHCFSSNLFKTIGMYDNEFNPFGYEDADLSIRSIKSGFKNFIISDIILIHDTQERFTARSYNEKLKLFSRSKKILLRKHTRNGLKLLHYASFIIFYPFQIARECKHQKIKSPFSNILTFWKLFIKS